MLRGKTYFRCYDCENIFQDIDMEYNMMVFSVPMPCHRCGSHRTYPTSVFSKIPILRDVELLREKMLKVPIYKEIWKTLNNEHKK